MSEIIETIETRAVLAVLDRLADEAAQKAATAPERFRPRLREQAAYARAQAQAARKHLLAAEAEA